jgi:hypothetical protein
LHPLTRSRPTRSTRALAFGRTLPRLLRQAGLVDVQADDFFPVASTACTALEAATVRQIRARQVEAGIATDADIDEQLANVARRPAGHDDRAADLRLGTQTQPGIAGLPPRVGELES